MEKSVKHKLTFIAVFITAIGSFPYIYGLKDSGVAYAQWFSKEIHFKGTGDAWLGKWSARALYKETSQVYKWWFEVSKGDKGYQIQTHTEGPDKTEILSIGPNQLEFLFNDALGTHITLTRINNTILGEVDQPNNKGLPRGRVEGHRKVSPSKKNNEVASFRVTDPESGITTTSVSNPDGSRTITRTDKDGELISEEQFPPKGKSLPKGVLVDPKSGKITAVITRPDGSRSIAKSKITVDEDGTGRSIAMDEEGNHIVSTITPDGVVTTQMTDKYGNTFEAALNEEGSLTSIEKTATGYSIETVRDPDGVNKLVKKDLDGNVMERIKKFPDGALVKKDKLGNMVEVAPTNANGETLTVRVDRKGNENLIITNENGETILREENRVTPKEPGREYYETVMGGENWNDLPESSKTRYAGSERRIRENEELRNQQQARNQKESNLKKQELELLQETHQKLDRDLAAIEAEQVEADKKAAERKARKARELEIEASYDKAEKLRKQYNAAIKNGDEKEARRIQELQDEHEQTSMDILKFTPEEKRVMEQKAALRQKMMDQIKREASFEAHKENMERTENDSYKDVALEGGSYLSIGAEQQRELAKSNRQEDRMLSYTKHKDKVIERLLNKKELTPEERDILIDIADMSGLQRVGALEKKAANNRIVAAGYAVDGALLLTGGVGNVAAGLGTKLVGKVVAKKIAKKVFTKKVAQGAATKSAAQAALKKGTKAGDKAADKLMKIAQYDLKTAASKKVVEKVVARKTARNVLAKKMSEGVSKEAAEKSAKKIGERAGRKVANEVGKDISEKGLINTVGSKVGGKIAEKVAGKQAGKVVEKALVQKPSLSRKSAKVLTKDSTVKETAQATGKTTARANVKTANKEPAVNSTGKKTSAMSRAERQAYNDARAQKQVSRKWREKSHLEDGGDDILPSPSGKPTDLPMGELSKDLTPKQIEELFIPGANLTRKQVQQKADLLRKQRMENRTANIDKAKPLRPPGKTMARKDPAKTLPPSDKTIVDRIGKNSVMPKGKVGGLPKGNIGGMPRGKVGGMPEGKVAGIPAGKVGGLGELKKGYPRGMPDGKVGGLLDRSLLKGKAGKPVIDPRPFGMLPRVMKSIQKEVNASGLKARIRAANDSAISKLRAGHPPKHVKLKSKTINDLDVQLGAPPGSQGEVGYFKPKLPENLPSPLKPGDRLLKRYKQRMKEYSDNFRDIKKLKDQGLISVEDGVVIDRGLSNTRLGKDGRLIVNRKGPEGGTGKGFTGDHDMWDITHPDGRPIIMDPNSPNFDPIAYQRKNKLQEALDKGLAQTQHGPHKDWKPITQRDIGIDRKIRSSHNPGGEALLEFTPNQPPRTSYEIDETGKVVLD